MGKGIKEDWLLIKESLFIEIFREVKKNSLSKV